MSGDAASAPKQHRTGVFVFGGVAAENAVSFITSNRTSGPDKEPIHPAEKARNAQFFSTNRPIDVRELGYRVRRLVRDYVVSPKNQYKLNQWLAWSESLRQDHRDHRVVRNGDELSELYEVENIVRCADFSAVASRTRKESRWGYNHSFAYGLSAQGRREWAAPPATGARTWFLYDSSGSKEPYRTKRSRGGVLMIETAMK